MININLLPYDLRPVKRSPLPYLGAVVVVALAVLGMMGSWVNMQARIAMQRKELAQHQSELDQLKAIVDEYENLENQKKRLADKIEIIHEILSDRTIWSRQLWNISRLTPPNFWYSDISVEEKSFKESRMVYNEKTKKEELKSEPVKRRVLRIGGYVVEGPDGSNDINPLTFNMEQDPEFSGVFQTDSAKLLDTEFEGFKVRSFTLEYVIKSGEAGA